MAYVRFENISFSYGDNQVLKDFSLSLPKNEIMCLVGPSGCGKTTLVRCLLGLSRPDQGEIYVDDVCMFSSKRRINVPAERRGIGIVFQTTLSAPLNREGKHCISLAQTAGQEGRNRSKSPKCTQTSEHE